MSFTITEIFRELFYLFKEFVLVAKTFHGYLLITYDGTRLNLPYNPSDKSTLVDNIEGRKAFNQTHLNALYDILTDAFLDVEIQGLMSLMKMEPKCKIKLRIKVKWSTIDLEVMYIWVILKRNTATE